MESFEDYVKLINKKKRLGDESYLQDIYDFVLTSNSFLSKIFKDYTEESETLFDKIFRYYYEYKDLKGELDNDEKFKEGLDDLSQNLFNILKKYNGYKKDVEKIVELSKMFIKSPIPLRSKKEEVLNSCNQIVDNINKFKKNSDGCISYTNCSYALLEERSNRKRIYFLSPVMPLNLMERYMQ